MLARPRNCLTCKTRSGWVGAPPGTRTPNPLFQDRMCRLLPNSAQHARSPGGTTNGDGRLIPVLGGQVGWFDGSRTEVAALPGLKQWTRPEFRSGRTIGTKSLRSVPLTTSSAGRQTCQRPHRSAAMSAGMGRWMSVVDVNSGSRLADQLRLGAPRHHPLIDH